MPREVDEEVEALANTAVCLDTFVLHNQCTGSC